MSLWDRFEDVMRSEWNSRFQDPFDAFRKDKEGQSGESSSSKSERKVSSAKVSGTRAKMPPAAHRKIKSAEAAYRLLELKEGASLDDVRVAYQKMAQRYHPETFNQNADKASAAQTLLSTLTEAMEVLEAKSLPIDQSPSAK